MNQSLREYIFMNALFKKLKEVTKMQENWNSGHDDYNINSTGSGKVYKSIFLYLGVIAIIVFAAFYYYENKDSGEKLTYKQLKYGCPVYYFSDKELKHKVAYIQKGQGRFTLLFIHGIGNYLKYFNPQIKHLSKKYKCVALDMPGYGKSSFYKHVKYSLDFHVASITNFISGLKLKNVVLIGHSYGGMVAVELAGKLKKIIQRLILISPVGLKEISKRTINIFSRMQNENRQLAVDDIRRAFKMFTFQNRGLTEKYLKENFALIRSGDYQKTYITRTRVLLDILPKLTRFHWRFAYLDLPILLISGDKDRVVPMFDFQNYGYKYFKTLEFKNSNAKVRFIKNCGHLSVIEAPDKVNEYIDEFLRK